MTGSGTQNDPYIIENVTDLQAIETNLSDYYELSSSIDASATSGWGGGLGFDPIALFEGSFNGKGYNVSNLFIARPLEDDVGLFGSTSGLNPATIIDVTLSDVDITGKDQVGALLGISTQDEAISDIIASGSITGKQFLGGMIGYINADTAAGYTAADCKSACSVTSTAVAGINNDVGGFIGYGNKIGITRCQVTGVVTGTGENVGGFIGYYADGTIVKSLVSGAVSTGNNGGDSFCGGFAGWAGGDSTDCYVTGAVTATGDYVGGFAGVSDNETNCYSTGAVTGVGANVGGFNGNEGGTTTECFWDTETSGQPASFGGTGKTTAQMKDAATFTAWALSTIWNLVPTCNTGYPCLIDVNTCCLVSVSNQVDMTIVGTKVILEGIRNLEMQYGGKFLISKSGDALWQSRYHRNV